MDYRSCSMAYNMLYGLHVLRIIDHNLWPTEHPLYSIPHVVRAIEHGLRTTEHVLRSIERALWTPERVPWRTGARNMFYGRICSIDKVTRCMTRSTCCCLRRPPRKHEVAKGPGSLWLPFFVDMARGDNRRGRR